VGFKAPAGCLEEITKDKEIQKNGKKKDFTINNDKVFTEIYWCPVNNTLHIRSA